MTDQRNTRIPQFFLTPGGPCPYLPGKVERKVFARLGGNLAQPLSEALTHSGFRRSQSIAYRPACEGCSACVSVRIRAGAFAPSRNQKRILRRSDDLHGANNLTKQTALNEKGEIVNGRGDTPNRHDILTGSQADGTAFSGTDDRTCKNWTSSVQGAAMVGHADRTGLNEEPPAKSWNMSHPSRGPDGGCSQADLKSTGGDGLLYCFAEK